MSTLRHTREALAVDGFDGFCPWCCCAGCSVDCSKHAALAEVERAEAVIEAARAIVGNNPSTLGPWDLRVQNIKGLERTLARFDAAQENGEACTHSDIQTCGICGDAANAYRALREIDAAQENGQTETGAGLENPDSPQQAPVSVCPCDGGDAACCGDPGDCGESCT